LGFCFGDGNQTQGFKIALGAGGIAQ
jgi:hypothetical protein